MWPSSAHTNSNGRSLVERFRPDAIKHFAKSSITDGYLQYNARCVHVEPEVLLMMILFAANVAASKRTTRRRAL